MAEQIIKTKKKKWFQLVSPKEFGNVMLGETPAEDTQQLVGRKITINMANVTNDIRQQSNTIQFKVVGVEGDKAQTEIIGWQTTHSAIRRAVRRGTTRIDETLVVETSDKKKVAIKPMLITKTIVGGSVAKQLRKALIELLRSEIGKNNYETLVRQVISNKLQMAIKGALKKIYPLKSCEIKAMRLL